MSVTMAVQGGKFKKKKIDGQENKCRHFRKNTARCPKACTHPGGPPGLNFELIVLQMRWDCVKACFVRVYLSEAFSSNVVHC